MYVSAKKERERSWVFLRRGLEFSNPRHCKQITIPLSKKGSMNRLVIERVLNVVLLNEKYGPEDHRLAAAMINRLENFSYDEALSQFRYWGLEYVKFLYRVLWMGEATECTRLDFDPHSLRIMRDFISDFAPDTFAMRGMNINREPYLFTQKPKYAEFFGPRCSRDAGGTESVGCLNEDEVEKFLILTSMKVEDTNCDYWRKWVAACTEDFNNCNGLLWLK